LGLSVRDLYALAHLDTAGAGGWMGFDLDLAGTRHDPEMGGTVRVEDLTVGDTQGPFVQGVLRYADRRLDGGLLLYRTGNPVLQLRYSLPLDLAFTAVKNRQVEGPLNVQAIADSVDLAVLEAVVPSIRQVGGTMNADVKVVGTWADPVLGGDLDLINGSLYATALGVPFSGINGRFLFEDDSVIVRSLEVRSERGSLAVTGDVKLEGLTRPVFDLTAQLSQFTAIEQRDFLSLTASGQLGIRGPFDRLVVSGSMTADRGVLYFADLLNKRIIDLDDPENLAFLDTTLVRRRKLGSDLSSRILQSIDVEDLRLDIGRDFWLRSAEANIQLGGRVTANRARGVYRVDGTMSALRGRYRLSPVPGFSRDFEVTRGDVRFFGTSDLNAGLDIEARYTVRTNRNAELPIIAVITGTLQDPKLRLESTVRPPLSELDIASYLVTGAPASEALAQGQSVLVTNVANYVFSASSSALEAAMQSELGMSIDMFQIRTINSPGASASALGSAIALDAGWQLSKAFFLRFNAGFCTVPNAPTFDYRNFGAAIEWRMNSWWRLQGVMEPVLRNCGVTALGSSVSSNLRYQLGADLLWDREF
jgi:translocation and assembly module TamB